MTPEFIGLKHFFFFCNLLQFLHVSSFCVLTPLVVISYAVACIHWQELEEVRARTRHLSLFMQPQGLSMESFHRDSGMVPSGQSESLRCGSGLQRGVQQNFHCLFKPSLRSPATFYWLHMNPNPFLTPQPRSNGGTYMRVDGSNIKFLLQETSQRDMLQTYLETKIHNILQKSQSLLQTMTKRTKKEVPWIYHIHAPLTRADI